MPINVSEALDADTCISLTIERITPGAYVNGLYVDGVTSTFKSLVSPQQPTAKDLERLPEAQRVKDIMVFHCKRRVRTVDDRNNTPADIIQFDGKRYEVIQLADWSTFGHTIAYGALL